MCIPLNTGKRCFIVNYMTVYWHMANSVGVGGYVFPIPATSRDDCGSYLRVELKLTQGV